MPSYNKTFRFQNQVNGFQHYQNDQNLACKTVASSYVDFY